MERTLEIFPDGSIYEYKDGLAVKAIPTHKQVKLLQKALQFTLAETFTIVAADQVPPVVTDSATRGGMTINSEGVNLIKSFEGMELEAYLDAVDVWTIGYGHTKTVEPGMMINEAQAEELLREDLAEFEEAVTEAVQVSINFNQFSALVSFCFNLGADSLFQSTLLKLLNQGDFQGAADQFPRWNKAGGQVLDRLTRRRKAEKALFLSQDWSVF
ncbi:Lysozyme (fragment) [Planktothrix agardhii]|uniref:lysozyme n=1 Tax=Planktothrix agardhii TaxID=1160 RepID=UPI001B9E3528